ncbi:hypothetical protein C0J52_13146 [Blattella germanica]|nr:hypothetical protein C0J52_13146 [Blattella germanica]
MKYCHNGVDLCYFYFSNWPMDMGKTFTIMCFADLFRENQFVAVTENNSGDSILLI